MKYVKVEVEMVDRELLVTITGSGEENRHDPVQFMERAMLSHDLDLALAKIGEMEARILRMRYGLNGYAPMTLNDVAKKIKLSCKRVHQIEERALMRLKKHIIKLGLIEEERKYNH
jgi:RNA polymerase sigma factor (sigma-70 family)